MRLILETWWYYHVIITPCFIKPSRCFYCIMPGLGSLSISWWRHQMETFTASLALCAGNSPVTGEFPAQRPVTRSFDVFFDLHLNKRLSKQSWGWWFETPSHPLWRHRNVISGEQNRWVRVLERYSAINGFNYFDDLLSIYTNLGLTYRLGQACAIASLVSKEPLFFIVHYVER